MLQVNKKFKEERKVRGRRKGLSGKSIVSECICPNCGERVFRKRGVLCFEKKCPKCGISMERLKYSRIRKSTGIWYANL